MKADRFQNEIENARENGGEPTLRISGRASRSGMGRCETPVRPPQRARRPRAAAQVTTITAKMDVGFGNALFIRGEGGGLSWDKGQPLVCVDGATWVWTARQTDRPVRFKLLINDQRWSRGENLEVCPGGQLEVVPAF